MGLLQRLSRRKDTHEQWLEKNPGKGKMVMGEPIVSDADQAATRSRMEEELNAQNTRNSAQ